VFKISDYNLNPNPGFSGPPLDAFEALKHAKSIYAEHRKLKILSIAAGAGVLSFLAARFLYASALQQIRPLNTLVTQNYTFYLSLTALFSLFCVGLPFLVALYFIKKIANGDPIVAGKPQNAFDMTLLVAAGFAACLAGGLVSSYFSAYVQDFFGIKFEYAMDPVPTQAIDIGLYFLSYAIVPAIVEEFALRGVVMQPLRKYGDWFAILMSSLVFALMHGNMVQVPFAFIAGIAMGFAVIKTGTLWTSIIIHFLTNASSLLQSIYLEKTASTGTSLLTVYVFYAVVILLGGVCAFFYFRRLQKRERELHRQRNPFAFPLKSVPVLYKDSRFPLGSCVGKYVATVPMLTAIAIMALQTVTSISLAG
jgi:membrane protease YdiL (CAAX protease family)